MATRTLVILRRALGVALLLFWAGGPATAAVTIDWVVVGHPNNPPDATGVCYAAGCGSVPYTYRISKYEVTNAQYVEFLNAQAASDPLGLYNPNMATHFTGGILRSGSSGSYTYAVRTGMDDRPVTFVSFWDSARFANWLQGWVRRAEAIAHG